MSRPGWPAATARLACGLARGRELSTEIGQLDRELADLVRSPGAAGHLRVCHPHRRHTSAWPNGTASPLVWSGTHRRFRRNRGGNRRRKPPRPSPPARTSLEHWRRGTCHPRDPGAPPADAPATRPGPGARWRCSITRSQAKLAGPKRCRSLVWPKPGHAVPRQTPGHPAPRVAGSGRGLGWFSARSVEAGEVAHPIPYGTSVREPRARLAVPQSTNSSTLRSGSAAVCAAGSGTDPSGRRWTSRQLRAAATSAATASITVGRMAAT